jgi:hypothetical protein
MSTGITWKNLAILDETGPPKNSVAPRKKTCELVLQEIAAVIDGTSARLRWFGAMM